MLTSLKGWKGDRVRLVPPDRSLHLENALRWLNDPEITRNIEFNLGISRKQEELFFDRVESPREGELTWAILDETENHIGFISIQSLNWRHRSCSGGLLIGERDAWGRGYATDAVKVRTRFAFDQLGLHRINGHSFNPAMQRVYEKCGYRHEGTARKMFWAEGHWHDVSFYGILEEDWRNPART
ncbi:MAG: GNAT family protein [Isosphaeraceae bacterium]